MKIFELVKLKGRMFGSKDATVGAESVLNRTDDFLHWKKLTLAHYPNAVLKIGIRQAVAQINGTHICAHWDAMSREGTVLHNLDGPPDT